MNTLNLPQYECIKRVRAARIIEAAWNDDDTGTLLLETVDGRLISHQVDKNFMEFEEPEVGGYFVEDEDGALYISASQFEAGFVRIPAAPVVRPEPDIELLAGQQWNQADMARMRALDTGRALLPQAAIIQSMPSDKDEP